MASGGTVGRLLLLRPMTVADVLDGAFHALRHVLGPAVVLVLVLIGPVRLLLNLVVQRYTPEAFGAGLLDGWLDLDAAPVLAPDDLLSLLGLSFLLGIVGFVTNIVAGAAVVTLVVRADRGLANDALAAVRSALGVFWTIVAATLLLVVVAIVVAVPLAMLSIVLLLVPFLGWAVLLVLWGGGYVLWLALTSLVVPVAVVERGGPIVTLQRVLWVLRARLWRVLGIAALVVLVVGGVTVGVTAALVVLAELTGPFAWLVQTVAEVLTSAISVPVTGIAALLIYVDARVRREGLDLRVRAGGPPPW